MRAAAPLLAVPRALRLPRGSWAPLAPLALAGLGLTGCAGASPEPEVPPASAAQATASPADGPASSAAAPLGPESAARVGFDRLTKFPDPGWHVPRNLHFSPDGKVLTFLASESQSDQMALFAADTATGAVRVLLRAADLPSRGGKLSVEEELRRERQRSRLEGITDYRWAGAANVMVLPAGGDVVVRRADGTLSRLTETDAPEIDPQPCPTGEKVAWVRDGDLFAMDVSGGKEVRLTKGGPEGTSRGLSDFVAQEEFEESSGFFWSPDCKAIAYLDVDERGVDTIPILGYRRADAAARMDQRYPRAGRPNPKVALRVVELASRSDRAVKLPGVVGTEPYLMRFRWAKDASALYLQALPRSQKERHLVRVDGKSLTAESVAKATSTAWVEPSPMVIEPDGNVLWLEDVEGHDHVVRRTARPGPPQILSRGPWDVIDLHGLDATGATLFATTNRDAVLGRQLDAMPLGEPRPPRRLTPEKGVHAVEVAPKGVAFADVHSAIDRLPEAVLRGPEGDVRARLPVGRDADLEKLQLRSAELLSLPVGGGVQIHGALLRPRDHDPDLTYPLVLMVYGGPGVQTVLDRWSPRPLWQHLADRGFFVAQFDNRGTSGRGPAFAHPIAGKLGEVELADQLAALQHLLANEPTLDARRVGIYGHSYGGFLSALAWVRHPGVFRAAVSGSPVTDWRLYDTGYTERYLGLPKENEAGYAASRLPDLVENLGRSRGGKLAQGPTDEPAGKLFLLHGLMDENVHFEHAGKLVDAMVAANAPFDLLVFPSERHGYRSPVARAYANRRVVDFLLRELGPSAPAPRSTVP